MDLSILIPIFNEEAILASSLEKLQRFLDQGSIAAEILLLDNGSTDQTPTVARELASRYSNVRSFRTELKGPGRAFQQGVREAHSEYLITLDADLSSDLSFIRHALLLLPQTDAVVGAKTFGRQRRTFFRVLGSQSFILCSQLLFDISVADFSMGAKAFRRSQLLPIIDSLDPWTGYVIEIVLHHQLHNLKVIQIGVDCNDSRESHFNLLHEARYRFTHLWRMKRLIGDASSWIHRGTTPSSGLSR